MQDEVITKEFVFGIIRRNKHTKRDAVILLSDFLVISEQAAEELYEKEFQNND